MDPGQQQSQVGHHHDLPSYGASSAGGYLNIDTAGGGADRFPQWSIQETRDFLMFRADLDPNFMETKRNKLLWELISTRMKDKGHNRSPLQCKCKWKNLVTRFKGCETTEAEAMRQQFPFYNEMQTIFTARMQRMMWMEAEGGGGASAAASSSKKKAVAQFSSDEDEDHIENDDMISTEGGSTGTKKKRKMMKAGTAAERNSVVNGVREIMEEYMKQQMEIEMQWLKCYEEREEKRRVKEMEWRQTMEALENERMMMERRWREKEEQRKIREEGRSEKREALITALLDKLRTQGM